MAEQDASTSPRPPHVKVVYKPVPTRGAAAKGRSACAPANAPSARSAFIRAENEDDDGYDPYSDRPADVEALFEENPWD